jgi:hypothetical protein
MIGGIWSTSLSHEQVLLQLNFKKDLVVTYYTIDTLGYADKHFLYMWYSADIYFSCSYYYHHHKCYYDQ